MNGELHRDGEPALIKSNGTKQWYQYGKLHRNDGPAVITEDIERWYQHGKVVCSKDVYMLQVIKLSMTLELPILLIYNVVTKLFEEEQLTMFQVWEIAKKIKFSD